MTECLRKRAEGLYWQSRGNVGTIMTECRSNVDYAAFQGRGSSYVCLDRYGGSVPGIPKKASDCSKWLDDEGNPVVPAINKPLERTDPVTAPGECTAARDQAQQLLKKGMQDVFPPECKANGEYQKEQRSPFGMNCVDREGKFVQGSTMQRGQPGRLNCDEWVDDNGNAVDRSKPSTKGKCKAEQEKALQEIKKGLQDVSPPRCKINGDYETEQSNFFNKYCVDREGNMVPGSSVKIQGKVNCDDWVDDNGYPRQGPVGVSTTPKSTSHRPTGADTANAMSTTKNYIKLVPMKRPMGLLYSARPD
ncbi:hypothetical protein RvY_04412 [Ramazzottius varieornatus]|uniref:Thyroglobulin type-1 domain-containing protein n=1 Tax=Ramazzottius varieornatus TaxID=947166 RepID=A0A1D1URI3_RAMVA|nr:hypothetical protein RvY_04412 [Ramazzottius varieornatus]